MGLSYPETNALTERIIGCAIAVHKELGPGLLESVCQECLYWELIDAELDANRELSVPILYRSRVIPAALRVDFIVNDAVIIEVKSVEKILAVHKSQLLTYLKLMHRPVGLLINFNVPRLIDGITRISL
jgi:GxxExxY protein